jgi:hypothetical protein
MNFIAWCLLIVGVLKIIAFFGSGNILRLFVGIIAIVAANYIWDNLPKETTLKAVSTASQPKQVKVGDTILIVDSVNHEQQLNVVKKLE